MHKPELEGSSKDTPCALSMRWDGLWKRCQLNGDPRPLCTRLLAAWSEPQRHYHALAHLQSGLALFDQYHSLATDPEGLEMAWWFHDAIYDPRASDNEQRSADWACAELARAGWDGSARLDVLKARILATRHGAAAAPDDDDTRLLLDIDLAILGTPASIYQRYEQQIRREYAHVPRWRYIVGRGRVLRHFLAEPALYQRPELRTRFETAARANLRRASRLTALWRASALR